MATPVRAAKRYLPPPRAKLGLRQQLIARLSAGYGSGPKLMVEIQA